MTEFEKHLRAALDLLDKVPVSGREERKRMYQAEAHVLAVAETLAKMEKEGRLHFAVKEEKPHDDAENRPE